MGFVKSLKCRECGRDFPLEALHVCEYCFGPLEVDYNYDEIKKVITRELIESRGSNMWRYKELLPLEGDPTVGMQVGFTPLVKAGNLAKVLGVEELYIKNDAVNFPSLSFKDRVVSVAMSRAREMGFKVVSCASTGNLANSVAANAAACGMENYVFIPHNLERSKVLGTLVYGTHVVGIKGTYDEVNRLCSEIAGRYGWAFVNINIRPYYAEGSKAFGFEIAEQLGWKTPKHVVVPMAGGSLICKILKAFKEFEKVGLLDDPVETKVYGAQAAGCNPIVRAVKAGKELIEPVHPDTIAKSLAIGNPADGYYAARTMRETGGTGEDVTDQEILDAMKLLAETEGIFAETAGGVTLGAAKKLIENGVIPRDESIVLSITGNGLKTQEALEGNLVEPPVINANIADFEELVSRSGEKYKAAAKG